MGYSHFYYKFLDVGMVMAKPFCRQASNTVTATALDKFRLRCPATIGNLMACPGVNDWRTVSLKPLVSEPNTR